MIQGRRNKYTENISMLKRRGESIIFLFTVFLLTTCIDPYTPNLSGYESLLVVDGQITNENSSYTVREYVDYELIGTRIKPDIPDELK